MTQSGIDLLDVGAIQSIRMPPGWPQGESLAQTIGFRYSLPYYDPANPNTNVSLFYRGMPLSVEQSAVFRNYLHGGERVIFSEGSELVINQSLIKTFQELTEILGNPGNNQILNNQIGIRGHMFHMLSTEVKRIGNKPVLASSGWFRDASRDTHGYDYVGVQFDGNPEEPECIVQEIALHCAGTEHLPAATKLFQQTLNSVEWR